MSGAIIPQSPHDAQRLESLGRLENRLREWIEAHQPSCAESFYQVDSVNEALPDLAEIVCDELGYYDEPASREGGSK